LDSLVDDLELEHKNRIKRQGLTTEVPATVGGLTGDSDPATSDVLGDDADYYEDQSYYSDKQPSFPGLDDDLPDSRIFEGGATVASVKKASLAQEDDIPSYQGDLPPVPQSQDYAYDIPSDQGDLPSPFTKFLDVPPSSDFNSTFGDQPSPPILAAPAQSDDLPDFVGGLPSASALNIFPEARISETGTILSSSTELAPDSEDASTLAFQSDDLSSLQNILPLVEDTTVESQTEDTSTIVSQTEDPSTIGSLTEGTSTIGSQTENPSTISSQTEDTSTIGSQREDTSTIGSQTDSISTIGLQTEDTSTISSQTEDTSTIGSQREDTSTIGSQTDGISTIGLQTKDTLTIGSPKEDTSTIGLQTKDTLTIGSPKKGYFNRWIASRRYFNLWITDRR
jgi:hypothetical protein